MPEKTVHTKVARRGYTYRGNSLSNGEIVRMTESQFKRTQRIRPPYLALATPEEVKRARRIIDLAQVEAPKAANVEAAEKAETRPAPKAVAKADPPAKK